MKHCLPAAFAIAFIGAAIICAQSQAQPQETSQQADVVTVIRAGKLIDTDAGAVLSNQIILIRGDKIAAVGKDIAIPAGATVIDLSNMTVLPGLIDCHTHLADGSENGSGDPLT